MANGKRRQALRPTKYEERYPYRHVPTTFFWGTPKPVKPKAAPSPIEQLIAVPGQWITGIQRRVGEAQAGYNKLLKALEPPNNNKRRK